MNTLGPMTKVTLDLCYWEFGFQIEQTNLFVSYKAKNDYKTKEGLEI
jgi:hypothetical protein